MKALRLKPLLKKLLKKLQKKPMKRFPKRFQKKLLKKDMAARSPRKKTAPRMMPGLQKEPQLKFRMTTGISR